MYSSFVFFFPPVDLQAEVEVSEFSVPESGHQTNLQKYQQGS